MKRQDYLWFVALLALLLLWPNLYSKFYPGANSPAPVEEAPAVTDEPLPEVIEPSVAPPEVVADETEALPEVIASDEPATPEQRVTLSNDEVTLTFTSHGAALVQAALKQYREYVDLNSGDVTFDFSSRPALAYLGNPGLPAGASYEVEAGASDREVVFTRAMGDLALRRTITLGEDYLLTVVDEFRNLTTQSRDLPDSEIFVGDMEEEKAHPTVYAIPTLGVDSLPAAGGVMHWTKKVPSYFKQVQEERELTVMPHSVIWRASDQPLDWIAAKNKYFAQILMPKVTGGDGLVIYADREISAAELAGGSSRGKATVTNVTAAIVLEGQSLEPGESVVREFEYYIGPKDYGRLSQLGYKRDAVMGFDENAYLDFITVPTAKLLLRTLNFIHDHVVASYGFAIMLLTFMIKVIFWPITHKSTESMRKMSELQPLMTKIREKYKDNPQRQSQEMMALYKEHKVNPVGGCIPMLIQIPVFFALFVVLRIAIELRFAEFLWIKDLSSPERLIEFGFALPIVGWDALNILPILMTLAMYWQQKLMPAGGDPQQQKIMRIMMPGMMFFMLYNFASGLALYWTTQNILVIIQQSIYQYRKKHGQVPAKA